MVYPVTATLLSKHLKETLETVAQISVYEDGRVKN